MLIVTTVVKSNLECKALHDAHDVRWLSMKSREAKQTPHMTQQMDISLLNTQLAYPKH